MMRVDASIAICGLVEFGSNVCVCVQIKCTITTRGLDLFQFRSMVVRSGPRMHD